jgi:hypothetical protein
MSSGVVILDLRDKGPDGALNEARDRLADQRISDMTRLVVLDDAWALADNRRAYEALLNSGRMNHLLCVAVGRLRHDRDSLQVPGSIDGGEGGSSVLWVIDSGGVDWRLASSAPVTTRAPGTGSGARRLIDVLTTPAVYDRVCELTAEIPDAVANPGLRLAELSGGQPEFLTALSAAASFMVDRRTARATPSAEVFEELVADMGGEVAVQPNERIGTLYQSCERSIAWATEMSERLIELGTPFGARLDMRDALAGVSGGLLDLRDTLTRLFEDANTPGDLSARDHDVLRANGVDSFAAASVDRTRVSAAIASYVEAALDAKNPLPRVSETLNVLERGLAPRGSRAHLPELRNACPDGLIDVLRNPTPFPSPEPWLPAAGAVATCLAALNGYAGLLMALLWTGLLALTVTRAPSGRPARASGAILVNLLAALAGGAIGVLAGARTAPSLAVGLGAAALGLTVAVVAAAVSWRARAVRWCGAIGLGEASAALEGLIDTLRRTAIQEWSRGLARAGVVDAITCARTAIDGVRVALEKFDEELRSDLSRFPPGTSEGNLGSTVHDQLVDLVLDALAPRWREVTTGDRTRPHERLARARTEELLAHWDRHVEKRGPLEPPDFARSRSTRRVRVGPEDLAEIARAAGHDSRDVMWQLCSPRDIAQLDTGGRRPPTVRFAPKIAQEAIAGELPFDVEWIDSVRHAGILRLVPVRPGAVNRTWFAEEGVS